jgi:glucokinase
VPAAGTGSPPVAGVDVGGTKILGRVLHPDDPRQSLVDVLADTPRGADAIAAALVEVVADLRNWLAATGREDLAGVGIGIAGLVDRNGILRFAPNLPGVIGFDVTRPLAAATGLTVSVDNDANCATLAEHRVGAGIGATDLVLVTLGTGIGGGVIAGGELQRGAAGFAGEPGHMVVDPKGPPCPCGRRGCWERYASGSGLGRLARDAAHAGRAEAVVALAGGDPEDVRGEHVTTAAADGDPDAVAVMREFAWWVALGVANLENLLDPDVVVIGGGLAEAGELLLAPTREAYATLVLGYEHRPPVRIVGAELGAEAGAIGAGLIVLDALG